MKKVILPLSELEVIAATRFVFGVGATLVLVHLLPARHRSWLGWLFVVIGVISTPPLMYDVYARRLQD